MKDRAGRLLKLVKLENARPPAAGRAVQRVGLAQSLVQNIRWNSRPAGGRARFRAPPASRVLLLGLSNILPPSPQIFRRRRRLPARESLFLQVPHGLRNPPLLRKNLRAGRADRAGGAARAGGARTRATARHRLCSSAPASASRRPGCRSRGSGARQTTAGVDPAGSREIRDLILDFKSALPSCSAPICLGRCMKICDRYRASPPHWRTGAAGKQDGLHQRCRTDPGKSAIRLWRSGVRPQVSMRRPPLSLIFLGNHPEAARAPSERIRDFLRLPLCAEDCFTSCYR